MGGHRATRIAVLLACLLAGCADHEVPGAPPSRSSAGRNEPALASTTATPAPPATPPEIPAPAAQDTRSKPVPPLAPIGVVAKALSSSQIALAWQGAPDSAAPAGYEIFRDERLVAKASELRFTDDHLRPWSDHCYAVQSYDEYGQRSARSALTCARTLDGTPPTIPGGLRAEARPVNSVTLTWLPSTDDDEVDGYEVSRGDKVIATGKTTGLLEPGLAPTKEYCYSVRALDRAGNRSTAAGPVCVVVPDTTAPTIPEKVAAVADGEHAIAVGWRASTDDAGVARYEIAADGPSARTLISAATTVREGDLGVATRHCYRVRACDASGNCSAWSPAACATTPDLTPPSPPSTPTAVAVSDAEVEVRWGVSTDNVGVTGYEVLRGDAVVAGTESGTTAREAGLRPAKQYCYAVRAHDLAGNTSMSAKVCATTPDLKPPTPPAHPAAVPVSSTQIFVAWDASTDDVGVAGYEVYRGASLVAKVTTTRAREYRLEPAREYCYTVRAFDAAGNRSPPAGPFCTVTTTPAELSAPSDLRVRRVSRTNILLQWEPSEAKGVVYRVYSQGDRLAGLASGNTFTPSGTLGAEPSCFRVAALDANDRESPKSNEVCATSGEGAQPAHQAHGNPSR